MLQRGKISYFIARSLIKIKFISLVNLIMDREVVKELIQQDLNTNQITKELHQILNPEFRAEMLQNYKELSQILGGRGASALTAKRMLEYLRNK